MIDPTYELSAKPLTQAPNAQKKADADWIWSTQTTDGQTLYFKKLVTLPRKPTSARLWIAVDDTFTLYVNGQKLDASVPGADGNGWRLTHALDLTQVLKPGTNVIAVVAHNISGAAGLIAHLDVDRVSIAVTNVSWKVSDSVPDAWVNATTTDDSWKAAIVKAPLEGAPWSEMGLINWPGYTSVQDYLAHLPMAARTVVDLTNGQGSITGAQSLLKLNKLSVQVTPAPAGSTSLPGFVLDFGQEVTGRIVARGEGSMLVGTGESKEEAVNAPWGGVHVLNLGREPIGTPDTAFRYAHIVFPAGTTPISLSELRLDHLYYPVRYQGYFRCSDSLLEKIWYTGAYTAHLCMQQDIWDAPKRDRVRWMGDLHVSGEVINNVFGDRFLMEQTMTRLRNDAQGGAPTTEPPRNHVNDIPGYSCAWVAGLADFYRHNGDTEYVRGQKDALVGMLDFLQGEVGDDGLFANKRGRWPFVDWAPQFNGDTPQARAATHLFYIYALREGAFLLRSIGNTADADRFNARADTLSEAARKSFVSPEGTYGDRRQENAMAIYSGVATPEQATAIYEKVLAPGTDAWKFVVSPYYGNYVLTAMSEAGHTDAALGYMRKFWGGMIEEGATTFWEGYDPSWEKKNFHAHLEADNSVGYFVSLCHGWSAGPTNFLTERVLGIRSTGPGFRTAVIEPNLANLEWAEGGVPTPRGILSASVHRTKAGGLHLQLVIPKVTTVDVRAGEKIAKVDGKRPARASEIVTLGAGTHTVDW